MAISKVWQQSSLIGQYATKPLAPLTLSRLLDIAKARDVTACALYVHNELPARLARRVAAIQKLPYIVGVNPFIENVGNLYRQSFHSLLDLEEPKDESSQQGFTKTLDELFHSHQHVIANLAQGFMECGRYMTKEDAKHFLDNMIHARIGIRGLSFDIVLAEHYLSLQYHRDHWMGVVNTQTHPAQLISQTCRHVQDLCDVNFGSSPEFEIIGHKDTTLAYIPVHMEYIFMELLKNAFRATVEFSQKMGRYDHPPVEISICRGESDVIVRIRDQGGGIPQQDLSRVWDYSYTTVPQSTDDEDFLTVQARLNLQHGTGGPIAGLGFGLPMSRIYGKPC